MQSGITNLRSRRSPHASLQGSLLEQSWQYSNGFGLGDDALCVVQAAGTVAVAEQWLDCGHSTAGTAPVCPMSLSLMVLRFWPWAAAHALAAMSPSMSSAAFATALRPSPETRNTSGSRHMTRLTRERGNPKGCALASCSALCSFSLPGLPPSAPSPAEGFRFFPNHSLHSPLATFS